MPAGERSYTCAKCSFRGPRSLFYERKGEARIVTSWCRECRSRAYYAKRWPVPCSTCAQHRRLDGNGLCRECNEASGLRECGMCGSLLLAELSFYRKRRTCLECEGKLRLVRRSR